MSHLWLPVVRLIYTTNMNCFSLSGAMKLVGTRRFSATRVPLYIFYQRLLDFIINRHMFDLYLYEFDFVFIPLSSIHLVFIPLSLIIC